MKNRKVFFKDPASGHDRIQFDGCPYIIVGWKVYNCQDGVDRHAKEKQRNHQNRGGEQKLPIDGYHERKMCCIEVYTVKQPILHLYGSKKETF